MGLVSLMVEVKHEDNVVDDFDGLCYVYGERKWRNRDKKANEPLGAYESSGATLEETSYDIRKQRR